jgi:hypothetical protein
MGAKGKKYGSAKSRSLKWEGWEATSSDATQTVRLPCVAAGQTGARGRITGRFAKTIEQVNKAHKGKDKKGT